VLFSSEWVDASEAQAMGLAWKVVAATDVLEEAQALAQRFAVHPLASLMATKRVLAATFSPAVAASLDREDAEFDVLLATPEHRAAIDAFVDGSS
jgi:enoyl-CoA hydratase/carnithine racemase